MRSFVVVFLLVVCGIASAQETDVGIELVGPHVANPGERLSYQLTTLNAGVDAADSASWSLTLPAGLGFAQLTQQSGSSWTCSTPTVGSDGTVNCQLASYAPGDTAVFALQFDVDGAAPPGSGYTLVGSVDTLTADLAEENDSSAGAVFIAPSQPDTFVEIAASGAVLAGGQLTYTLRVGNTGVGAADNVMLNQALAGSMTFVSLQSISGPNPTCSTPAVGAGGTLSCIWASLAPGAVAILQLVADVPGGTPSGTELLGQASVTSGNGGSNEENDVATTQSVVSATELALAATAPASANAGEVVSYAITLANAGPDAATGVVLRTAVPAGSTLQSFTQDAGPTFACLLPASGGSGTIECSTAALAPAATASFTLTVSIGQGFAHNTPLRLQGTLSGSEADTDAGDNSVLTDVTIANTVDIALSQTGPASANAGQSATFRLTLANAGPDAGRNVRLDNPIPANTRFVSVQQVTGSGFSCSGPAVGAGSGIIVCSGATLAAGASVAFDVVLRVDESVADGGTISNAASVSNDVPDSAAANNSTSLGTPVVNRANLQVTVSAPAQVSGGTAMAIDITARNLGASPAQALALGSATPSGTTFVSLAQTSGPNFACVAPALDASGAVACTITALDAGAVAVFRLTVNVPPNQPAGSWISYGASIVSSTVDPAAGNNSASGNSSVVSRVDLQVSLSNGRSRVLPGQDQLYALVAANAGPADATGAALMFQVPPGLTTVAWTCVPAQSTATCPAPSSGTGSLSLALNLPTGTHLRFDLIGTVTAAVGATLLARADIATAAAHSEQNPTNNQATDSDLVSAPVLFADGFEAPPAAGLTVKAAIAVSEP